MSSNKARERTIDFILGFFLGIIGLLIIAMIPANQERQWEREDS